MASARKRCSDCGRRRALSAFGSRTRNNRPIGVYVLHRCRDCERRDLFPRNLKRYGITVEEFARLEHAQDYTCAICPEPLGSSPAVDHCHATRKVRGLLCNHCNLGLGHLRDDPDILASAINYLAVA